jgi:hypothetical protein
LEAEEEEKLTRNKFNIKDPQIEGAIQNVVATTELCTLGLAVTVRTSSFNSTNSALFPYTGCIYLFHEILKINGHHFLTQNSPTCFAD